MIKLSSLPRICVAIGRRESAQLQRLARSACESGERFLELRIDILDRPETGIPVIRRVMRQHPRTVIIATCRRTPNGGRFDGGIDEQAEVLGRALSAGAALVDVEIETAEAEPQILERFRGSSRVIVSCHDFEKTPALGPVLSRLKKIPADIYKIATTVRKPSDNMRLLDLASGNQETPLVILGMGEAGAPSRILGPSRGSIFGFGAPDAGAPARKRGGPAAAQRPGPHAATAPGQISASLMRGRYQVQKRRSSSAVYGVIASPVGHSMSPALHNRAFQSKRIDAVYLPFLVEPGQLADFFRVARELPVAGFSVTIPHKLGVRRHLHSVDRLAERIGAVNTVYRRAGKLCGTNTDAIGVTAPLEKRTPLKKATVLIAGNGGAARGAIFATKAKGARVTLTGRNARRVRALARACGVEAIEREKLTDRHFDILIHTTPLGMSPNVDSCFFGDDIPADLVFDMVYNPLETLLLKKARLAGKQTISGLEMFLEQAAAQFEIWTGETAPRTVMKKTVLEALGAA
jgi:3-dehydroquinate dehydratase/shikimate dehydrogenase